jgi:hypothetical protein
MLPRCLNPPVLDRADWLVGTDEPCAKPSKQVSYQDQGGRLTGSTPARTRLKNKKTEHEAVDAEITSTSFCLPCALAYAYPPPVASASSRGRIIRIAVPVSWQ